MNEKWKFAATSHTGAFARMPFERMPFERARECVSPLKNERHFLCGPK